MKSCRELKCLQLYVQLVNIVNQDLIFTWKLLSLGVCIASGYAAISHFGDHPVFGIMYCMLFVDSALIYILIYDKAFKVPALFGRAKMLIDLTAGVQGGKQRCQRMILKRQLAGIPQVGIKVGEFHTLERNSIPLFLDYVLTHVVGMLVANK